MRKRVVSNEVEMNENLKPQSPEALQDIEKQRELRDLEFDADFFNTVIRFRRIGGNVGPLVESYLDWKKGKDETEHDNSR